MKVWENHCVAGSLPYFTVPLTLTSIEHVPCELIEAAKEVGLASKLLSRGSLVSGWQSEVMTSCVDGGKVLTKVAKTSAPAYGVPESI